MTSAPDPADRSVRLAWADDARAVAEVQAKVWHQRFASVLPESARTVDVEAAAEAWHQALSRPVQARQRLLVALDRQRVCGFAVVAPSSDVDSVAGRDAELIELAVDPAERGHGHGARLLHAVADTMRADGFQRAVIWLLTDEDDLRRFLTDSGWAPDGAHRELDLDGSGRVVVKQVRLHCSVA